MFTAGQPAGKPGAEDPEPAVFVQRKFFHKNAKKAVDRKRGRRLYTQHNEGGAPLATKSLALVKIRESRVSDTPLGLSQKQEPATSRLWCLFFDN